VSNMGISWRRRVVSQTSILACVILFIFVIALVIEAHPAKRERRRVRHESSAKSRGVGTKASSSHRRHHWKGRSVNLTDALSLTLCAYKVYDDINEYRVPKVIRQVECVKNGSRCRVVKNTGTYSCTQLMSTMIVTINDKEVPYDVNYACVCAARSGFGVSETLPEVINK
jgi:hypothetical protein